MSNLNNLIENRIVPAMAKIGENKVLKSITAGMLSTMPLSLGTSIVAIIANFPNSSWTTWLKDTGIATHTSAIISGTTTIVAVYLAFIIGYYFAKENKVEPMGAGVLSLGAFLILMPQTITLADGSTINALSQTYLGSSGIFMAILSGILISGLYCFLVKKGLAIKLPESVPEMVSKSLSPTFVAMIIFITVLVVRILFGLTQYGNAFDAINNLIGKPVMQLGSSPYSLIGLYAMANLLWCFGIHPSAITSFYTPVFLTVITSNITAFSNGEALPYLAFMMIYQFMMLGGTGCTLGLTVDMLLFGKSSRFKTLGKLAIIPNIFNINEPVIFGAPIIYNPVFMLPMTLVAIVNGFLVLFLTGIGIFNTYNPTIRVPWTLPGPAIHFLQSGIIPAIIALSVIIIDALIYLPFFKIADKTAMIEESKIEQEKNVIEDLSEA